jgi:glycosyltransferase involved in cell wall biosynthesis
LRIVIDGLPVQGDNSLSIVAEHLLAGWSELHGEDEIHIVIRNDAQIAIPNDVTAHRVEFGRVPFISRLYSQSVIVPRLCRQLDADILLGVLPATTVTPMKRPRAIIVYDMRYKLRPDQFSAKSLLLRRVSYGIGFREADALICLSDRTRNDLLALYPHLRRKQVRAAHLGADHVDSWPARRPDEDYDIAFGHFNNKNVDLVLDAWAMMCAGGQATMPLRLLGLSASDRGPVEARIEQLGLGELVTTFHWLPIEQFREQFASSSLVVFPSDFEGFGLPVVEAMRLGIPVVITPDPALLEVTAGYATVMDGFGPEALVQAVAAAGRISADKVDGARRHAQGFTWSNFALQVRQLLVETAATQRRPARVRPVPLGVQPASGALALDGVVVPLAPRLAHRGRSRSTRWAGAAAIAVAGATAVSAVSYALVGSHPSSAHHPAVVSGTPVAASAASGSGRAPATASGPQSSTPGTQAPTQAATGSTGNGSNGSSPLPTVTVPTVTGPTVTVPPVTVPTVTVPRCSTATTIPTTVVTIPCGITVSPALCGCP